MTFYISVVLGFMFAGPAVANFGVNTIFVFIGLLFLAATMLVSYLPGVDSWIELGKSLRVDFRVKVFFFDKFRIHFLQNLTEGFNYLLKNKSVQDAIFLLTASQVLIATISAIAPGYATTVLRISMTDASLIIVTPAVFGMIAGSIVMGLLSHKINRARLIDGSIFSSGILLTVLSFLSRGKYRNYINFDYIIRIDILGLAVLSFFLLGIVNSLITVSAGTALQEDTKEDVRSRIYGFMTSAGGLASIFPVLLAGILSDAMGVVKVMLFIGLSVILFSGIRIAKHLKLI